MLPQITHAEMPWFIELAIKTGENSLFVGRPGVGKSVGVKAFADNEGYNLVLSHPAVWEPTDAKGLPAKSKIIVDQIVEKQSGNQDEIDLDDDLDSLLEGLSETAKTTTEVVKKEIECATFLPFDDLLRVLTATEPTIWFLDDLGQAPPSVQAALMQYLEAGELEGKKIPDCVHIVAATNGREHKAGVRGLLEPVKSRFSMILELVPDVDSSRDYMLGKGYPFQICDYWGYKPDALIAKEFNPGMENSPDPRLWEKLGKSMLKVRDWKSELFGKVCCATLGESTGRDFHTFLATYTKIPKYEEIVADPLGLPIDHMPDVRYALLGMLAHKAQRKHHQQIFTYIARLKKSYQVVFIRSIHAIDSELLETPSCISWLADNSDLYMQALVSMDNSFV